MQRVFHQGDDVPVTTAAEIVKATDAVARASKDDATSRAVDADGCLAKLLQGSPREVRSAARGDAFGDDLVVWPRLLEISLLGALGCGARLCKRALQDRARDYDALVLQATRSAVGFYETLGLARVGTVARYRDRADAPRLAYRHWCTRVVDEPSYVMARTLGRARKRAASSSSSASPLDAATCRSRALELAHVAFLANLTAPGANAAFRECVLLATGYAGAAGARDKALALALAEVLRTFRNNEVADARRLLRAAFLSRVSSDSGTARRSPRGADGKALDVAGAVDGGSVALVDGVAKRVCLRADSLVSAARCTEGNGLLKVKIAFGRLLNGKYYKVQHRRVLARIRNADSRRRVLFRGHKDVPIPGKEKWTGKYVPGK